MKKYFSTFYLIFGLSFQVHAATMNQSQGLVGSVWTGDGQSGDGYISYLFHFNQDKLSLDSTCHVAEISSTLKSDLAVSITQSGNVVELTSGLQAKIPAGQGSCLVNFPAGLKFQLDHDQIYIEYGGIRRITQMKRQN